MNRKLKKEYNRLFKIDPIIANLFLLLHELADKDGQVKMPADEDEMLEQIQILMQARFNDPLGYAI